MLLDFWGIGCGPCRMAEAEMNDFYEKMKDKLVNTKPATFDFREGDGEDVFVIRNISF